MADVSGVRQTLNVTQAQRKIDMHDEILLLEPDAAPLVVFSKANQMKRKACHNPEYSWVEDALRPRFDRINDATPPVAADTTWTVDNGAYFRTGDIVLVPRTGEAVQVTAVATNDLTVVRSVGAPAAANLVDNEELLIIGSAQPEADLSKAAMSDNPDQVKNYTQIFREPWHSSETQRHSDQFTRPNDWAHQARKSGIEHAKDIEYAFLFGRKDERTASAGVSVTGPLRTTGGAYEFVTTNITNAGGALTEAELFGALRPAFRYGRREKVGFASQLTVDVLNGFPRGKLELRQSDMDKTYGVRVFEYISPHGTLNLVTHYLIEGIDSTGVFNGDLLVLDFEPIYYRYLANENGSRDTHINTEIQAPDADARKDEYLSECGLQFGEEKKHARLYGITS